MDELSVQEINIIKHSLGLDYKKEAFRNHFSAGPNHTEISILNNLVSKGFMTKRASPFVKEDFIFHVTEKGENFLNSIK